MDWLIDWISWHDRLVFVESLSWSPRSTQSTKASYSIPCRKCHSDRISPRLITQTSNSIKIARKFGDQLWRPACDIVGYNEHDSEASACRKAIQLVLLSCTTNIRKSIPCQIVPVASEIHFCSQLVISFSRIPFRSIRGRARPCSAVGWDRRVGP